MTRAQQAAVNQLKARCSIRGIVTYRDGTIQVGFESSGGPDREAVIARDGRRLETRNTYE